MAKKEERSYRVQRVEETKPEKEWCEAPEMKPMPMAEINSGGVAIAFFVLICAAGFTVYLLHRVFRGVGIGTAIGCLVVAAILIAAVIGMIATTIHKFREDTHRLRLVLTIISFFTALCIGVAVGLSMPV